MSLELFKERVGFGKLSVLNGLDRVTAESVRSRIVPPWRFAKVRNGFLLSLKNFDDRLGALFRGYVTFAKGDQHGVQHPAASTEPGAVCRDLRLGLIEFRAQVRQAFQLPGTIDRIIYDPIKEWKFVYIV